SLLSNTIANPKGELKAITTQSVLVLDGPSVLMPPLFINLEEDERVEETLTDSELVEDPLHPHIHYPSRMHQEKQQEKDEVQIHKIWQMFKQLHINISLADALILILKYQKMLKFILSNKEKLLELANTPLNENCSAVILKKLPEKLGDPRKFLILCGFSELKCKALADLGNLYTGWNCKCRNQEITSLHNYEQEIKLGDDEKKCRENKSWEGLLAKWNVTNEPTTSPSLPLSLSFDFVFVSEIFKSLSFRLDRLFHLAILCLDQHAHTLHHLESLLIISLDRLDIFEGRSCISEFVRKSLSLILELS
ncbi:hypothetical protein Tco_0877806, partial [Tanacetum coccineum]